MPDVDAFYRIQGFPLGLSFYFLSVFFNYNIAVIALEICNIVDALATVLMKNKISKILIAFLCFVTLNGCFEDLDDVFQPAGTLEIQDFIYKAMNIWYLYKPDVPDLANDRFASQGELNDFLNNYATPEELYSNLLSDVDRFSFITNDYRVLLNQLDGITKTHGMEFGLVYYPDSETNIFGYVQYVLPNSDAAAKGVQRGMIFNTINGAQITENNYADLSTMDSYEIGLATFDGEEITPTGETIALTKMELAENPVHVATTITVENEKIGYLMYNGFTGEYESELNQAFGMFQNENITKLVLDLRYNSGGSVNTATRLASMVTGQFSGEVFYTEHWNPELQANFEQNSPQDLVTNFMTQLASGQPLNSLQLTKLYVLTTQRTASASELVINGLKPYIDVVQIGETTTGKFQASTTFFDSEPPYFPRDGATLGHFYAIQPLIYKTANANGVTDYVDGLFPDVEVSEDFSNLGELGDPNETLLAVAIDEILNGRSQPLMDYVQLKKAGNSKQHLPTYQRMYDQVNTKELQ